MQAVWRGTVQIARLQIPVKLYAAAEEKEVVLRLRHKECDHPVRQVKYCERCGETVVPDRLTRVYELGGGRAVEVGEDELRRIAPVPDKRFRVRHFVPSADVSPLFMKKYYYVGYDEAGEEALALIHQGLFRQGRMGIGYIALRSAQQLAGLWAAGDRLLLTTLHYANEVRSGEGTAELRAEGPGRQLEEEFTALIGHLTVSFEPGQYSNLYNEALKKLVGAKLARLAPEDPVPFLEPEEAGGEAEDLLSALRLSLKDIGHS
ncbi:Ku protein [Cohnella thermotolerans]|uniref:non-homologous end joining protein Ku n=1 Tax=Cohnella thermotolerans TaxID=329858 RepID=UPI00146FB213|nr:Ku protein [Cohnella thermotolerans]